jgi:hypothetical protein
LGGRERSGHDVIVVATERIGGCDVPAVVFAREDIRLSIEVVGPVGNSVATSVQGKRRLDEWKITVAMSARANRGPNPLDPAWTYAVSLGFRFNPQAHGYQQLDVENFMKPTLDALAAGLFCPNDQSIRDIKRYAFDDSNFRYLFVHRLRDAPSLEQEGAVLVVSMMRSP